LDFQTLKALIKNPAPIKNKIMEISPINNSLRIYKTIPKSIKLIPVFIKLNSFNEDFENISPGNPYLNLNINYHLPISSFVGNLFNLNFENNKL
jgi:hypothetical protein